MRTRLLATVAALAMVSLISTPGALKAQAPAALSGQVSSAEEGNMEGVLVSAKKAGSSITVTVVSDAQGRFSFPANRLEPGQYTLTTRAIGYDLDGPQSVEVAAGKTADAKVKLTKTKNLAHQMSNGEWIRSIPGNEQQKMSLLNCVSCHS